MSAQALDKLRDELRSLTTTELGDVLGVEVWRVREMAKAGEAPPHLKLGRILSLPGSGCAAMVRRANQRRLSHTGFRKANRAARAERYTGAACGSGVVHGVG